MADQSKIVDALKSILECLNKDSKSKEDIDAMEVENEKLRQEKFELMTKLHQLLKINPTQVVLTEDLTSQLAKQNKIQAQLKEIASQRMEERSQKTSEQVAFFKEKMKTTENYETLPHDEIVKKIREMEIKTEENLQKIARLSEEYEKKTQHLVELKNFKETLKQMEKEQKRQLKKFRKKKI